MSDETIPAFLAENLLYLFYQRMEREEKSGINGGTGSREN